MHAPNFVEQQQTIILGYLNFQTDIKQENNKRRDGGLHIRNVRLYICFYADVHQKTRSCICMEFWLTQKSSTFMALYLTERSSA